MICCGCSGTRERGNDVLSMYARFEIWGCITPATAPWLKTDVWYRQLGTCGRCVGGWIRNEDVYITEYITIETFFGRYCLYWNWNWCMWSTQTHITWWWNLKDSSAAAAGWFKDTSTDVSQDADHGKSLILPFGSRWSVDRRGDRWSGSITPMDANVVAGVVWWSRR